MLDFRKKVLPDNSHVLGKRLLLLFNKVLIKCQQLRHQSFASNEAAVGCNDEVQYRAHLLSRVWWNVTSLTQKIKLSSLFSFFYLSYMKNIFCPDMIPQIRWCMYVCVCLTINALISSVFGKDFYRGVCCTQFYSSSTLFTMQSPGK